MQKIDLKVSDLLLDHLQKAIEINAPDIFEIVVMKGTSDNSQETHWVMTIIPEDVANQIKEDYKDPENECHINANGLVLLAYPPELTNELNGKYMAWDNDGVHLVDQH